MAKYISEKILNDHDTDKLSTWIGKQCQFQLLYRLSRHGLSADTFHQLCDGKGPTVTVLYNTIGNVFGGYLSQSWNSNNVPITDENAFLFKLRVRYHPCMEKFGIRVPAMAACGVREWGPTFGGRATAGGSVSNWQETACFSELSSCQNARFWDLHTFFYYSDKISRKRKCNFKRKKCGKRALGSQRNFALNGEENLGSNYDRCVFNKEKNFKLELLQSDDEPLSGGDFNVRDLEVYLVKEWKTPEKSVATVQPWREAPLWTSPSLLSLQDYISKYHPIEDTSVTNVNILLLGEVGAGKSSFFNTINSIFRGEITSRACAGSSEHSLTTTLRKYRVRDPSSSQYLNLRLCDMRGLEESVGVKTQDIALVLDGHIPEHYQFNPASHATLKSHGFKRDPNLQDKIHTVAFVIDASTINVINTAVIHQMKEIQSLIIERGIPQVIYLTKLDKICTDVDNDVKKIFMSTACKQAVETVADVIGVPRSHVFPVKNYEKESRLHTPIDILALSALRQTLVFADDYLEDQSEFAE